MKEQLSRNTAVTQYLGLTLKSFVTGLVSAAVTGVTRPCVNQVVDIVGAAVLNLNVDWAFATVSIPVDAEISSDCALSHSGMISLQPDGIVSITSSLWWTCGHHFCTCSSLEAIPAIEVKVTFGAFCYMVMFSCSICQIFVLLTYIR